MYRSAHRISSSVPTAILLCALLGGMTAPCAARAGGLDFLVPGISLGSVRFESGAAVSYLIISESYGIPDTSLVELSVLETGGGYTIVEVSTAPYPVTVEETIRVRMRLSEGVRAIESPEEFSSFVDEVLVKEGDGPFEEPSEEDLEELELERMFLPSPPDSLHAMLGREDVQSPAGLFSCEKSVITRDEENEVSLGGVPAIRVERESTTLWISREIPFWGLVRSRIERESGTRLEGRPPLRQQPRRSVTESILVSFSPAGR